MSSNISFLGVMVGFKLTGNTDIGARLPKIQSSFWTENEMLDKKNIFKKCFN
jgi:hypothetical protein